LPGVKTSGGEEESVAAGGAVMTPAGEMAAVFSWSPLRIHCLVLGKRRSGHRAAGQTIYWQAERHAGPYDPSLAVRRAVVQRLTASLPVPPHHLTIHRDRTPLGTKGPPRIFLAGHPTAIDLSLSHDGCYTAFALMMAPAGR